MDIIAAVFALAAAAVFVPGGPSYLAGPLLIAAALLVGK